LDGVAAALSGARGSSSTASPSMAVGIFVVTSLPAIEPSLVSANVP
jgi:hypothetical protein